MRRRAPLLALAAVVALAAGAGAVRTSLADRDRGAVACPDDLVPAGRWADVAADSRFELAISCLADQGVVTGVGATEYAPTSTATRGELDASVARLAELAGVEVELPDADPGAPATRGEAASALVRLADAAGLADPAVQDAFDDDEESVHEPAIDRLVALGITSGTGPDRSFDPDGALSREQLAGQLAAVLDLLVRRDVTDAPYAGEPTPPVRLDQAGRLVEPGSVLSGVVPGRRTTAARMVSPCVGTVALADEDRDAGGLQFAVPTDRQAPIGRCPVDVEVAFDNGRTRTERLFVVVPGYSEAPEMVHVEQVGTSTREGYPTSDVRFLFDAPVRVADEGERRFTLTTYDVQGSHIATSVRQDGERAAVATFGTAAQPVGPSELRQVSRATAFGGAMRDAQGRPTPTGTAHLNPRSTSADAYAGPTWGADLLSVTAQRPDPERPGAFLVDLVFDAPLGAGEAVTESQYAFDVVLEDASGHRCEALDRLPRRRLTVSCPAAGTVAHGVVSAPGFGVDDPVAASLLTRRPTAAPDVVDARWGPMPDALTLVFDEPVTAVTADRFLVRGPHPPWAGSGRRATLSADRREVVVRLAGTGIEHSSLLTVRSGAVTSAATGRPSLLVQLPLPARVVEVLPAGRTVLPDLLAVRVDADAVVRFEYDQPLAPAEPGFSPGEDLRLYLRDGTELVCRRPEPVGGSDLACRDFGVGGAAGPAAAPRQVAAAVYATASGTTPPEARVVEGARR